MSFLAGFIGNILSFIFDIVNSYGLSIIILTILMKLVLLPLSIKQIKSTNKISEIQPRIKELQEKYKDDKETLNSKMMELYKKEGVNPLSGCLPMLVQLPILFGLFAVLRDPAQYVFAGSAEAADAAVNVSFLWVKSLNNPDLLGNIISSGPSWLLGLPGLLPIISAASTYLQMNTMKSSGAQQGSMKTMGTIMPLFILYMGINFASGLMLYWTVSNLFQIAQQALVPKVVKGD